MSTGVTLLLAILCGLAGVLALQWWMARRMRALEGEPMPPLPEGFALGDASLLWFHSPTCGPCRAMHPQVEPLVAAGEAREVDVAEHPEVAMAFGIMATPTTVGVRDGKVVGVATGVLSTAQLRALSKR